MKKLILFLFIISCLQVVVGQSVDKDNKDDLNYILNKYVKYLKSEGYNPEIDDEEVKFKREGDTFWIDVVDEKIFKISRYLALDEDQDCSKSLYKILNDFHFKRINERARLYDSCKTVEISSVNHIGNANDWKYILKRSTTWLDYAVEDFWDLYDELD